MYFRGVGKSKVGVAIAILFVSTFGLASPAAASSSVLGSAGSFAVLAGSGITNTGYSEVTGNIGSHPTPAFTGAGEVKAKTGTKYSEPAGAVANAKRDLATAYDNIYWRVPIETVFGDLGGRTLVPGVYHSSGPMSITGALTLNGGGDPAAVFIFQATSTLITASASRVVLVNGAQAANVFWQVGSSATFGTYSRFSGTVLALTSITATTGASFAGCLLARNGTVTLDSNRIGGGCGATAILGTVTPGPALPGAATLGEATPGRALPGPATSDTATPETATPETATPNTATPDTATPRPTTPDADTSATLGTLAGDLIADLTASVASVLTPDDSDAPTGIGAPAANLASALGAASSRVQKVFANTLKVDVAPAPDFASALDTAGARVRALTQTSTTERPPEGNWFWALIEPGGPGGGLTDTWVAQSDVIGAGTWELIEPGTVAVVLAETSKAGRTAGSDSYWALIERDEKAEAFMCSPEEGADDTSPFDSAQR